MISFFLITGCSKDDPPVPRYRTCGAAGWIVGADISLLSRLRAAGAVYKNSDGMDVDVLPISGKRIQLCKGPPVREPRLQSSAQDLPYVQDLIRKLKKGYYVLLNFHYSDTWADPGKQYKPVVWDIWAEAPQKGVRLYKGNTCHTK